MAFARVTIRAYLRGPGARRLSGELVSGKRKKSNPDGIFFSRIPVFFPFFFFFPFFSSVNLSHLPRFRPASFPPFFSVNRLQGL